MQAAVTMQAMAIASIFSSSAITMDMGSRMAKVGILPQPRALSAKVITPMIMGINAARLPARRIIFFAKRSMVPLLTAMEKRNAGPISETNRLVLKLAMMALSATPPMRPRIRAAPMAR